MKNKLFLLCMFLQLGVSVQSAESSKKPMAKKLGMNDLRQMIKEEYAKWNQEIDLDNKHWWLDNRVSKFMFRLVNQQETLSGWIKANRSAKDAVEKEGDVLYQISRQAAIKLGLNLDEFNSFREQILDEQRRKILKEHDDFRESTERTLLQLQLSRR